MWLMGTLAGLALAAPLWAAENGFPAPVEWSHKHLIITNAATPQQRMAASQDPRNISNWLRRTQALSAAAGRTLGNRNRTRILPRPPMQRDWSVSLGAGRVAPAMSPAKWGMITSSTFLIVNCTTDYVVYGLDAAATPNTSGGQANLVFLRNLYSGSNGYCGAATIAASPSGAVRSAGVTTITSTTAHSFTAGMQVAVANVADTSFNGVFTVTSVPSATSFTYSQALTNSASGGGTASFAQASVMAAYNISTQSGGRILTSPSLSLDGTKVAFVESTPTASIFHVLTLDPCTYSTAGCTNNGTSATNSAVPGTGNAAALLSIAYSTSSNTRSSPWIDYSGTGTAYVGDDNGTLYRIVNVFAGTPAVDTTFGGSGKLVLNSGTMLTGPVVTQGWMLVGDSMGLLWAAQATSPYAILGSLQVGGGVSGGFTYGIYDPPLVDASTTGVLSAFITSGESPSGNFTLAQAKLTIATQTFALTTVANAGSGAGNTHINAHAPAFDNNYYLGNITATTGFIYTCGMQAASTHPKLYRYGFTAGSPPTMNSGANGQVALNNSSVECSPMTEFANSNLTIKDLLFVGDSGNEVQSFNISGSMPGGATAVATEPGGTSGIIIDTTQLPNQQGSSIYFTTLSNVGGNCGANNYCAIKLTQAALQ